MLKFYLRKMWKYGRVKLFVFCQCIPHGLNFLWNPQFVWSKKISRWPSFQVPNWDQVNQLFSKFQRNLLISKISLKLIEYFVYLVPVCGPGSWVIVKFSYLTQIEDFRKNSTHGEYIKKIQEASHGRIFPFLLHLDKNGEKEIGMTRVTVLYQQNEMNF